MLVRAEGWCGTQGEPVRFHDLRHAFATLVIKDRVMDVMALSRILGHRDASMTLNVYADALEESKRSGMDALDATL
jgi:integrase